MPDDGKVREFPFTERARARRELQTEIAAVNWLIRHFAADLPEDQSHSIGNQTWRQLAAGPLPG